MPVYFISDQHLGESKNEDKKKHLLISFLDTIKGNCDALFIVGDLFDFYFEYKTQIRKEYYDVISKLDELRKTGTEIYYLTGNHDFWVGDFFEQIGVKVYKEPLDITLQGRRLFIAHGNDCLHFDPLRIILRNKLSIFLFYLIHPDMAVLIGRLVSKLSKRIKRSGTGWKRLLSFAKEKFREGFSGAIFGHFHKPVYLENRGNTFLLLGDWIKHFSYGKLDEGKLSLHFFDTRG
jgi:UDP-2,3-diacylglucosamine hydrolase